MEARRRLFYVAMTRAKEALQISYAAQNEKEKPLQRAIFVDEVLQAGLEMEQRQAPADQLLAAQTSLLLESKPVAQRLDPTAIAELLEGFALSVSSLNKFLRCPLSFYYENVLRVPVLVSEAAWNGIAMHDALYRGFLKYVAAPSNSPKGGGNHREGSSPFGGGREGAGLGGGFRQIVRAGASKPSGIF